MLSSRVKCEESWIIFGSPTLVFSLEQLQELEEQLREKTDQVSTQKQRLEQLERSDTEQKTTLVELRDVISQLEAELEAASDSVSVQAYTPLSCTGL